MDMIVLMLMQYTKPVDSFLIMINFLEHYGFREQFSFTKNGINKDFYILLRLQQKKLPALYHKFLHAEIPYCP